MQRLVIASKSPATGTGRLVPSRLRLFIEAVPPRDQFQFGCARRKHSLSSVPIHQRLQPFHSSPSRQTMSSATPTFHDLKADLPGDKTYDFDQLKGKVVLIVNVASRWYVELSYFSALRDNPEDADDVTIAGLHRSTKASYLSRLLTMTGQTTSRSQACKTCMTNTKTAGS